MLKKIEDLPFFLGLRKVQMTVVGILCIIVPLLTVYQVILRYVLKMPLMGIEELMMFPVIWLYMLGGANASMERNHISCGILTLYIKKAKTMALFNLVKSTIAMVVAVWLTYWAFWYFSYSLRMWKLSDLLYLPMFFAESSLFIGLVLMVMYGMFELYDNAMIVVGVYKKAEV
jgi:TRAP-type C4-dicarboxylate transport system permease small subunit